MVITQYQNNYTKESKGDRVFCAGAWFDELSSVSNFKEGKSFFMGFANVINAENVHLLSAEYKEKLLVEESEWHAGDYCFATKFSSIKLSELAVGIGPVVGPAVERKSGLSAYSTLSINATKWFIQNGQEKKEYTRKF